MGKIKKTYHTLPLKLSYANFRRDVLMVPMPHLEILIRCAAAVCALMIAAYVTLVGTTILNVIARKESLDASVRLRTAVSVLERTYFSLSQGMTSAEGEADGLSSVSRTSYVYRPSVVGVANVRNDI